MQYILSAFVLIAAASCTFGQDICPLIYAPVCGSDGNTYSNKCFFGFAQKTKPTLTIKHSGICTKSKRDVTDCPESSKHGICTLEYAPVCASNDVTYPNKCSMCADMYMNNKKEGKDVILTVKHYGVCKSKRDVSDEDDCPETSKHGICTLEYAPVCASNGETYATKCNMCAHKYKQGDVKLRVVHPGRCGSFDYCLPRDNTGACTREYMPICGSNGKTYPNRCTFCYAKNQEETSGKSLSMEYTGECLSCPEMSKKGACPRNYRPVCGSDGKTYGNLCMLCVEKYNQHRQDSGMALRLEHEGACKFEATLYSAEFCRPEWKTGICTREYNPICGSDGVTYGNPCTFCYSMFEKQAKGNDIRVKREGQCLKEDKLECPKSLANGICTLEYSPVCGTDGIVYSNKCMFCYAQQKKLKEGVEMYFDHMGMCYIEIKINMKCNFIVLVIFVAVFVSCTASRPCSFGKTPVCASDGKTYSNICVFFAKMDLSLYMVHSGSCTIYDSCSENNQHIICTEEYNPVCASNGQTYGNKCEMCADSYKKTKTGEDDVDLKVIYAGKCGTFDYCLESDKSGKCTEEYLPICGSNEVTYPNRCIFCYNKYWLFEKNSEVITMEYVGKCLHCSEMSKDGICSREFNPFCGSDGRTYGNLCMLCAEIYRQKQAGTYEKLSFLHTGECPIKVYVSLGKQKFAFIYINIVQTKKIIFSLINMQHILVLFTAASCLFLLVQCSCSDDNSATDALTKGPCTIHDPCPGKNENGICTTEYSPVCASNDQTYSNKCEMCAEVYKQRKEDEDFSLKVIRPGKCESFDYCLENDKSGKCTDENVPICASCPVQSHSRDVSHCADQEDNPICGSTGKTYNNTCLFQVATLIDTSLYIAHPGKCTIYDLCPEISDYYKCNDAYHPVCASNAITYGNKCKMCSDLYRQRKEIDISIHFQVIHTGICGTLDYCLESDMKEECSKDYNPVCASNGITYASRCVFCFNKHHPIHQDNEIVLEHVGKCLYCPKLSKRGICPRGGNPVCSSDDTTFENLCMLCAEIYRQKKRGTYINLAIQHNGECQISNSPAYDANFQLSHVDPESFQYSPEPYESFESFEYSPEPFEPFEYRPEPFQYPDVEPEPFQYTDIEPEPFQLSHVDPEPFQLSQVEPEPFQLGQVEPEPFQFEHDGESFQIPIDQEPFHHADFEPFQINDQEPHVLDDIDHDKFSSFTARDKMVSAVIILLVLAGALTFDGSTASDCSSSVCPSIWNPLCGSDGKTYANDCEMKIARCKNPNLTENHAGSCEFQCHPFMKWMCTDEYDPQCGSDGTTYPNHCMLCAAMYNGSDNLKVINRGPCKKVEFEDKSYLNPGCDEQILKIECTQDEFPLCGTNGITYGNPCKFCKGFYALKKAGTELNVKNLGKCPKHEDCPISPINACPLNYAPVCASDDNTYPNLCAMCAAMYKEHKPLRVVYEGVCQAPVEDEIQIECLPFETMGLCNKQYSPVCGTNGVTYGNKCALCYAMSQRHDLKLDHPGVCIIETTTVDSTEIKCDMNIKDCSKESHPVCATDGTTVPNDCVFCMYKSDREKDGVKVGLAHRGECRPEEYCTEMSKFGACPYTYFPLCATDGKSYPNLCVMCAEMYKQRKNGHFDFVLRKLHEGICGFQPPMYYEEDFCAGVGKNGVQVCSEEYSPYCGSDHATYKNKCQFCREMYEREGKGGLLSVNMEGECPENSNCSSSDLNGACPDNYMPVCGSDGVTYANNCERCAEMSRRHQAGENIFIYNKYKGKCPNSTLLMMAQPVSKIGRLYSNFSFVFNHYHHKNSISRTITNSLVRFSSSESSANKNSTKWQLMSAVCLERKPIITQSLNEIETRFTKLLEELEYEQSLKSDHEMRLQEDLLRSEQLKRGQTLKPELETTIIETAQDLEDKAAAELEKFQFAGRLTEADAKNDQKSLQRALDQHLILVVRQKLGRDFKWVLPQAPWKEGETMRQTAERVLEHICGNKIQARFLGNTPCGFYKYKYPRQMWGEGKPSGAKVFFFKAHYVMGDVEPFQDEVEDFKWLKLEEMRELLRPSYFDAVSSFLVHSQEGSRTEKSKYDELNRFKLKKRAVEMFVFNKFAAICKHKSLHFLSEDGRCNPVSGREFPANEMREVPIDNETNTNYGFADQFYATTNMKTITLQGVISPDDKQWTYNINLQELELRNDGKQKIKCLWIQQSGITLALIEKHNNRMLQTHDVSKLALANFSGFKLKDQPMSKTSDYIEKFITTGVTINGSTYRFFGCSNSQLKTKTCYLYAATLPQITKMIDSMGAFSDMNSVAKKMKRIGLLFTSTDVGIELKPREYKDIDDIVGNNGDIFTDGCGFITRKFAEIVARKMKITFRNKSYVPSVFQIRYKGYKGIVVQSYDLKGQFKVQLRKSMKKFNGCEDDTFSAKNYSMPNQRRGLLEKQDKYFDFIRHSTNDVNVAFEFCCYKNQIELAERIVNEGLTPGIQRELKKLQTFEWKCVTQTCDDEKKKKIRIYIPESRLLYGVCDPSGKLKEGEVFVRILTGGSKMTIDGAEIVASRNPCLHTGDIQKFKAVDIPELHYLQDVIVFAVVGQRPAASLLSGGDLDGDKFFVCWDKELIPETLFEPYGYPPAKLAIDRNITHSKLIKYFVRWNNSSLGKIKNLYLDWCRAQQDGAASPECQELNALFSSAVDAEKVSIPEKLLNPPVNPDRSFIVDTLWDNLKRKAAVRMRCEPELIALNPEENIEMLLTSDVDTLSEFDVFKLVHDVCIRYKNMEITDYLRHFDFDAFSDVEKRWTIQMLKYFGNYSDLLLNSLNGSQILKEDELRDHLLHTSVDHWKKLYSSDDDDEGRRLAVNFTRCMSEFKRKLIVFKVNDLLKVAIYIPIAMDCLFETTKTFVVDDAIKVFAFTNARNGSPMVNTVKDHKVEFNDKVPDGGKTKIVVEISIALQNFNKSVESHVGRVQKEQCQSIEIYVMSHRDKIGHQLLDISMNDVQTINVRSCVENIPKEFDVPKLSDINFEEYPDVYKKILIEKKLNFLEDLNDVNKFKDIFEICYETDEKFVLCKIIEYILKNCGKIQKYKQILQLLLDSIQRLPFIALEVSDCLGTDAVANLSQIEYLKLLKGLINCCNELPSFASLQIKLVLTILRDKSVKFSFGDVVELSRAILFGIRCKSVATEHSQVLLDDFKHLFSEDDESCIDYFRKFVMAICVDYLAEVDDNTEIDAQSNPIPSGKEVLCRNVKPTEDIGIYSAEIRLDSHPRPKNNDRVRFVCATAKPLDKPIAFDAIVQSVKRGSFTFKIQQETPNILEKASWILIPCATTTTLMTTFDSILELVTKKENSTSEFNTIVSTSDPNSNSNPQNLNSSSILTFHSNKLNESQKRAIREALSKPFTLIWGPPGTGKTTVVVETIFQLNYTFQDVQILVCASTHNAVDNILETFIQLRDRNINDESVIRVATEVGKVKPTLQNWTIDAFVGKNINDDFKAKREAKRRLKLATFIFTTCTGAGLGLLRDEKFQIVIIDEASQLTEPNCLIPIAKGSKKIILVGDHVQLRPTVTMDAEVYNLQLSLFERLYTESSVTKTMLNVQYRMNPKLAEIASEMCYEGQLRSRVGEDERQPPESSFVWPRNGEKSFPAVFVECSTGESQFSKSKLNEGQATCVADIVRRFRPVGDSNAGSFSIAVLSPYSKQVDLIKGKVRNFSSVEVNTIDGFQGREADVVIVSTVRKNDNHVLGFCDDPRRINVALTRAKVGLVVVGHRQTLESSRLWKDYLEMMKKIFIVLMFNHDIYLKMKIAVEGCAHGDLEKIYASVEMLQKKHNIKVDLLICCGDFQSVRNEVDLNCLAAPPRYREMKSFYKFYSGELKAPILTIFIGGNHEASNYLAELPFGGWVCPNIYYMGLANVIRVGGLRIGGLSGIFKPNDYFRGHFEFFPYNNSTVRSVYHVRNLDVFRLKQIGGPVDIFLSHDWPRGVHEYGSVGHLLRRKPFFREDIEAGRLGSAPAAELLHALKPRYWFSAHLHVKFSALIEHNDELSSKTRFLALDKCLPHRDFLQILDIPHDLDKPIQLQYDPEWLYILKATDHLLSTSHGTVYMPGPGCDERYDFTPTIEDINDTIRHLNEDLLIPFNFSRTAPIYNAANMSLDEPQRAQCNPQTTEFCDKLNVTDLQKTLIEKMKKSEGGAAAPQYSFSFLQSPSLSQQSLNPDEISLSDNEEVSEENPNKSASDGGFKTEQIPPSGIEGSDDVDQSEQSMGGLFAVDRVGNTQLQKVSREFLVVN
uniref:Large ribosomal subunit protein mL46 n=1 Tax=Strigamia maritima TaxID=126957 RepID=T1IXA6_STRMM